jgi:hypothetical protein
MRSLKSELAKLTPSIARQVRETHNACATQQYFRQLPNQSKLAQEPCYLLIWVIHLSKMPGTGNVVFPTGAAVVASSVPVPAPGQEAVQLVSQSAFSRQTCSGQVPCCCPACPTTVPQHGASWPAVCALERVMSSGVEPASSPHPDPNTACSTLKTMTFSSAASWHCASVQAGQRACVACGAMQEAGCSVHRTGQPARRAMVDGRTDQLK